MKTKVAINGFGRIGRNAFKIAFERQDLEIVAINDLTDTKTLAHLLKHDSTYGAYQHDVSSDEQNIIIKDSPIKALAEKDPAKLPWGDLGVEVVVESTGLFTDPAKARAHVEAGAKKVVISAPSDGDGAQTVVIGVNDDKLADAGDVISNASCTTNCITPVMGVLEAEFGIEKAMMTTIHSYTQDQRLQDAPHKDLRRARNAATNIVPTTTGATKAAAKALTALEGIFGGLSIRVPTPVVSLSDFVIVTRKQVTIEEVNAAFKKATSNPFYQGILDITEEELVSSDFIGNSHSAIVDLKLTAVVGGNLVKVVAWYDNEWGYSNRLVELTADVGRLLQGGGASEDSKVKKTEEAKEDTDAKSAHHHHVDEKDKPLLLPSEAIGDTHKDLLETSVPNLEAKEKELLPAEDGDKSAVGEDTGGAGYIIGDDQPKHPLPSDATNIDGVHRF
ncbi:type I glyceraldehyde-3-phosphate dehydrogenase [Candidatus Saccharibacteria bacterium]|nr:type I glyceraldehyde-3-phosphate dehydrogenase [Candidatus Saccharibacteria bacterium]